MPDLTVFPLPLAVESAAQNLLRVQNNERAGKPPSTERSRAPRSPNGGKRCAKEELRHILVGSPEAVRQAIHQLHVLGYADSSLWSPVNAVRSRVIITPAQGAAISLLKRLQ